MQRGEVVCAKVSHHGDVGGKRVVGQHVPANVAQQTVARLYAHDVVQGGEVVQVEGYYLEHLTWVFLQIFAYVMVEGQVCVQAGELIVLRGVQRQCLLGQLLLVLQCVLRLA